MKVILAQCASYRNSTIDSQCKTLIEQLRRAEHRTDLLIIPSIGTGFDALMAVASHRLMNLQDSCDALICLDRVACLLPHDRKFALLLDQDFDEEITHIASENDYLSNLIEQGLREAKSLSLALRGARKGQSSANVRLDIAPLLRELG